MRQLGPFVGTRSLQVIREFVGGFLVWIGVTILMVVVWWVIMGGGKK